MLSNGSTRDAQGREHVTRRTDAQMQAHNNKLEIYIDYKALEYFISSKVLNIQ